MKISELIQELQAILSSDGDLPAVRSPVEGESGDDQDIDDVYVINANMRRLAPDEKGQLHFISETVKSVYIM